MNKDKELEEAKRIYNELKNHKEIIGNIDTDFFFKFAEIVLQALKDKDIIINEMAEYLGIVRDCPNEDKGVNIDCENRCSNDDNIYAECWKLYFKNKIKED